MTAAYIALGGNLGDVRATFDAAINDLLTRAGARLLARSSDYRTPPWGESDQPAFINACIAIDTPLAPHALLAAIHATEQTLGRHRELEKRWGPRPIDLDILSYGESRLDEPGLTIPHPRLLERAFVLVPLAEIAPDLAISGTRVGEALTRQSTRGIERLPPREP